MNNSIALVAGQGDLPLDILRQCQACKISCVVICLHNQINEEVLHLCKINNIPHQINCIGEVSKMLDFLKNHNIKEIIFAGNVRRPSLTEISLDKGGVMWLKKLGSKFMQGDDSLLKGLIELIQNEGFEVKAPHDFLNLFIQSKILSSHAPSEVDLEDIAKGKKILEVISHLDIGQAVIVQQGLVLGIEAIEGTEALIKRVSLLKRSSKGGVLIKMAKINQTDKIDLPTIGPDTIHQVHEAGLNGIALEASKGYVVNLEETLVKANQLNVFLVGII